MEILRAISNYIIAVIELLLSGGSTQSTMHDEMVWVIIQAFALHSLQRVVFRPSDPEKEID